MEAGTQGWWDGEHATGSTTSFPCAQTVLMALTRHNGMDKCALIGNKILCCSSPPGSISALFYPVFGKCVLTSSFSPSCSSGSCLSLSLSNQSETCWGASTGQTSRKSFHSLIQPRRWWTEPSRKPWAQELCQHWHRRAQPRLCGPGRQGGRRAPPGCHRPQKGGQEGALRFLKFLL